MTETQPTATGTFHVVCHDCRYERLATDEDEARTLVEAHASDTGHSVESGRVV